MGWRIFPKGEILAVLITFFEFLFLLFFLNWFVSLDRDRDPDPDADSINPYMFP